MNKTHANKHPFSFYLLTGVHSVTLSPSHQNGLGPSWLWYLYYPPWGESIRVLMGQHLYPGAVLLRQPVLQEAKRHPLVHVHDRVLICHGESPLPWYVATLDNIDPVI